MATLAVRQGDILFFQRSLMWMITAERTKGLRPYRPIFEDLSRPPSPVGHDHGRERDGAGRDDPNPVKGSTDES